MRTTIYLPDVENPKPSTIGERNLFSSKIWKLIVMLGFKWSDLNWNKNGFSFLKGTNVKRQEQIVDFMFENGIEFKLSETSYMTVYKVSLKKSNISTIDKLYIEYHQKMVDSFPDAGIAYRVNNLFMDTSTYQYKYCTNKIVK